MNIRAKQLAELLFGGYKLSIRIYFDGESYDTVPVVDNTPVAERLLWLVDGADNPLVETFLVYHEDNKIVYIGGK